MKYGLTIIFAALILNTATWSQSVSEGIEYALGGQSLPPEMVIPPIHKLGEIFFPPGFNRIVNELKLFGIKSIAQTDSNLDNYVLSCLIKYVSENSLELSGPYANEITRVYSFEELPDIRMYYFSGIPAYGALFNTSDSTLYVFGDCISQFSKTLRSYLPQIIDENQFEDIIILYLNSIFIIDAYYIVSSVDDFNKIWDAEFAKPDRPFVSDTLKIIKPIDLETCSKLFKNITIGKLIDKNRIIYSIKVVTWEWLDGAIEEWRFRLSDKVFTVNYRKPIAINKGPWHGRIESIWEK